MKTPIKLIVNSTVFSFLFFLIIVSCSKSEKENKSFVSLSIDAVNISKGIIDANISSQQPNFVIDDNTQWQLLLDNFNTSQPNITNNFSQTIIDFNNFQIIVVTQGFGSSSNVKILSVIENVDNITLTTERRLGYLEDYGYAYHIVKIPKSTKPVIFQ